MLHFKSDLFCNICKGEKKSADFSICGLNSYIFLVYGLSTADYGLKKTRGHWPTFPQPTLSLFLFQLYRVELRAINIDSSANGARRPI
jgi:hypothetical protein